MADVNIRIKAQVAEAKQAIAQVKRELSGIAPVAREADSGSDFGKTSKGLENVSGQLSGIKKTLIGVFAGIASINTLKQMAQLAEIAKVLDARIKIATRSSFEFAQAQAQVRQISLSTGTALEANVGLFQKLRVIAKMAQGDAIKLTEIIAKATQLDGGGAGAQAAIFQLQQGLASGTLRGEELNSVLEQTPSLAKAIADGLGLSIAQMRALAANGELTAGKVKEALFKMSDDINANYAQLPLTTARAFQNIRTNAITELGQLDQAAGITDKLAAGLQLLADNMGIVIKLLAGALIIVLQAAITVGVKWAAAIVAQQIAAARAAAANVAYMTSIAGAGRAATVATATVGRFTVALGLLRGALALLGGPIGVLVTALLSLGLFLANKFGPGKTAIDQTRQSAEALSASLGKINDQVSKATGAIRSQFDAAIGRIAESTKAVEESYKAQTEVITGELQRRIVAIDAQAAAEQQGAAASLETVIATEQQKRDAIGESSAAAFATWQRTYDGLIAAAKIAGEDTRAIEQQATGERLRLIQQYEQAYRGSVDRLIGEEQRLLNEVRQRGIERANLQKSVEDIIRGLRRSTLDEYAAFQDKNKEIDEKQAEIRRLIAKGDLESLAKAQKLSEEAIRAAQANSSEVTRVVERDGKQVTEVVVSKQQAVEKSIREVQESARLAAEAMQKMDQQQLAGAEQARTEAETAKTQLEALGIEADKTRKKFEEGIAVKFEADLSKLESALADAQRLVKANKIAIKMEADLAQITAQLEELAKFPDRLPKLKPELELSADNLRAQMAELAENTKENNIELPVGINLDDATRALSDFQTDVSSQLKIETASDHTVSSNVPQVATEIDSLNGKNTTSTHTVVTRNVSANNAGGLIAPIARFAQGGAVGFPGMTGGVVPGSGNGDTVPRTLQAGSFVLRKAAVGKYGLGNLKGLLGTVKRFADGGEVKEKEKAKVDNFALKDMGQGAILARAEQLGGLRLRKEIEAEMEQGFRRLVGTSNFGGIGDVMNAAIEKLDQIQLRKERRAEIEQRRPRQTNKQRDVAVLPFATGGAAGLSSDDTVPAMLTPGEVVVDRGTVKRLGLGFFHALNNLKAPQRILGFNQGGIVPGAPLPDVGKSGVAKVVNVKLTLPNGQSRNVQAVGDTDGNLLDALRIAGLSAT